ncbi:MAG: hypothetical protein ACFCVF_09515 [Kineosporiaceae bacterium]
MTAGSVDLEKAAQDVYGAAPSEFLSRRSEWVARARAAGAREAAAAIGKLRRPTVTAWLVNLLARDSEGASGLGELAALGDRTRAAQAGLDAAALRELDQRRRKLVPTLVVRAGELGATAGQPVSATVQRELTETLTAAVATEAAAAAVTSGTLTRALVYSGFGEVDVEAAAAVLRPVVEQRPVEPEAEPEPGRGEDVLARHRRAAADALAVAEGDLAAARAAADDASRREEAVRARRDDAAALVDELGRRLAEAQESLRAAETGLAAAAAASARLDAARQAAESAVAERRAAGGLSG